VQSVGAAVTRFSPGDAVVGFAPSSFGNRLVTREAALSHIPAGVSFEAAATIPSTFFTAYYSLHHLARLQPGEKVLIHGAAGGVGIAAIQVAKWCGAEIYATAGSNEKRNFLALLGVDHVFDSRSLSYADEILAQTQGQGVDVVLNSLAGEAINRNFSVLKPFGRFLELGKRDFYENTRIGLRPFRNNISYFGIDADQLMSERPDLTRHLFAEVLALFDERVLHPLPYQAFHAAEVIDAFRHMQQARQIGKIVVTYGDGIPEPAPPRSTGRQRLALSDKASYLVAGGLSGFGLRTAEWLADRGARHLVLFGRRGPGAEEAQTVLARLEKRGIQVLARACDVTDRVALAGLLDEVAQKMPPLRGVVHAAMVIDDGLIRDMTAAQIRRVLAPKILGAMYLDELTRGVPLDFFVLYSSATTLFGNPGQGNYVAANAALEALARARRARSCPRPACSGEPSTTSASSRATRRSRKRCRVAWAARRCRRQWRWRGWRSMLFAIARISGCSIRVGGRWPASCPAPRRLSSRTSAAAIDRRATARRRAPWICSACCATLPDEELSDHRHRHAQGRDRRDPALYARTRSTPTRSLQEHGPGLPDGRGTGGGDREPLRAAPARHGLSDTPNMAKLASWIIRHLRSEEAGRVAPIMPTRPGLQIERMVAQPACIGNAGRGARTDRG
jgi:NADPH:quinone reductase-like Zn-dependent oxidoreductase/NADP-dependent 3-hydroxy acid dehydrogenase YdfG